MNLQAATLSVNNPAEEPKTPIGRMFFGRATRMEYWINIIVPSAIIGILAGIAEAFGDDPSSAITTFGTLSGADIVLYVIAIPLLIWTWGVSWQRCHDLGWSGWLVLLFWLVCFIPFVGWIVTWGFNIFLGFKDGQPFTNRYGPDPKGRNLTDGQLQCSSQPPQSPKLQQALLGEQLRELKKLQNEGALTQEEFDEQKAKILKGIS